KFAEEAQEISDEIVAVRESDGFIDLSQYIYEFIVLALPVRKLHKTGECDPCIIEALERKHSNEETLKSPDPRWQALQQIRN
ncbi:MAG: DUF177 domain-containing protein, partial [Flavobacteriales bacterium]